MKFTTSLNYRYPGRPRPWIDGGNFSEKECINEYFLDEIKVYDADLCGNIWVEFVFDNGRAYLLEYSWWIEYDPEWDLCEEKIIKEIPLSDVKKCQTKYRDWIP